MGRMAVHLPGGGALIASREGEGYVVKPGS